MPARSFGGGSKAAELRSAVTLTLRGCQLAGAGSALLLSWALCRLLKTVAGRAVANRLHARAVARTCQALGPTFIKTAQIASTRPDLVPELLQKELARLRHDVTPHRLAPGDLPERLRTAIAEGRLEVTATPVASGSIANVYLARERESGRALVLKVRRPGLARRIRTDFRLMRAGARLVERLPGLVSLPASQALAELEPLVIMQTEFETEAINLSHFERTYRSWDGLLLPEPVPAWSGPDVLAMTYLPGLDKTWLEKPANEHTQAQVSLAVAFLFDTVFIAGKVHGDMHPGNLIFRDDGKVAILDFGMVVDMTAFRKRMFVYFFFGLITNSPNMCAHVLLKTALAQEERFDEAEFRADLTALIGRYTALTAGDYQVAAFINELFVMQRRHGLRASPEFLTTVLAFLMLEGTVKVLWPDYDFQGAARDYILKNGIRAGILDPGEPDVQNPRSGATA